MWYFIIDLGGVICALAALALLFAGVYMMSPDPWYWATGFDIFACVFRGLSVWLEE